MQSPSQSATNSCLPWGMKPVITLNATVSYLQFMLQLWLAIEQINVYLSLQLGSFCNSQNNLRLGYDLNLSRPALGPTQPPI